MDELAPFSESDRLMVPRGNGIGGAMVIDLKSIAEIEKRIEEVQCLTPLKAPGLLASFNIAWRDLHRDITFLSYHLDLAETSVQEAKSVVILDRAPEILKTKGLTKSSNPAGSADLREAVLAMDEDYKRAQQRLQYIRCVVELLKGKLKSFQMAYDSVKKILGETAYNGIQRFNPELNGMSGTGQVGQNAPSMAQTAAATPYDDFEMFGKTR